MTKLKFLMSLHDKLSDLPQDEVEERLNFYSEMIEDRIEEGLSEEKAVAAVGSVEEIAAQIASDISLSNIAKERIKPKRRLKAWEIVLLVLGAPIWLSLAIAAFAVILSLYVVVWSLIVSLWAVFGSFVACAFAGVACGFGFAFGGKALSGIALVGAGLVLAGLSIFTFYGCKAATEGTVLLTKKIVLGIKKRLTKKEEA